jgi:ATP-dependent DNA ligase
MVIRRQPTPARTLCSGRNGKLTAEHQRAAALDSVVATGVSTAHCQKPMARKRSHSAGNALHPPYAPMEARLVTDIPVGEHWQYEPKWDGFRCLIFRTDRAVEIQSKSGKPLTRYFPELVDEIDE